LGCGASVTAFLFKFLETLVKNSTHSTYFDFRSSLHENRLVGLWRMMRDFRFSYLAATIVLAILVLAKTSFYLLLRFFADDVLGE